VRRGAIDPPVEPIHVNRTARMTQGGTIATNSRRDVSLRVRRSPGGAVRIARSDAARERTPLERSAHTAAEQAVDRDVAIG
jgi:hypothetical protein